MDSPLDPSDPNFANNLAALEDPIPPHTLLEKNSNRLAFIDPEFLLRQETRGIRFQLEMLKPEVELKARGIERTIVVFGSARYRSQQDAQEQLRLALSSGRQEDIDRAEVQARNSFYYEQARLFGAKVVQSSAKLPISKRLYVCTGGGPGIMEAANRGAHEAGGLNIGLNIALPHEQHSNPYISPGLNFKFHYFALRKMHFLMRAQALVAFPGGYGTLDELFEILTLVQCKKAQPVPIVLFGSQHWKNLINFDLLLAEGAISPQDLTLFQYADSHEQAWEQIAAFYKL